MKFKYVGDNAAISLYDFDFPNGVAVDIPDDAIAYRTRKRSNMYDKEKVVLTVLVIDKLKAHAEFEQVADLNIVKQPEEQDAEQPDTVLGAVEQAEALDALDAIEAEVQGMDGRSKEAKALRKALDDKRTELTQAS